MTLKDLKNILTILEDYSEGVETIESEEPLKKSIDIHDIIRVLERFKKDKTFKKVYRTCFDFDRSGNSISLIFKVSSIKKSVSLDDILESEFVTDLFKELKDNNVSNYLVKRLSNRGNYKLHLHGDLGVYQTPYFKVTL